MKTVRTSILTSLVLITCLLHATAQTEYFYYYNNQKMPLTLNENKITINVPKDNEEISERISANIQTLFNLEATVRGVSYFDMIAVTRSEYEKLTSMDFWKEDSKSVILSNFFYTERHAEVMTNPFLSVKLKKAEDADLLVPYVENYKLRNLGNLYKNLPLIYSLILTPESEKNSLDVANELQESGVFQYSQPDFSFNAVLDETQVHGITVKKKENPSGLFDLQGRPVQSIPTHGVYVKESRKIVR